MGTDAGETVERADTPTGWLAQPDSAGPQPRGETAAPAGYGHPAIPAGSADRHEPAGPLETGWDDPDWLLCRDGKWRPVESGHEQMVNGLSRGLGLVRSDEGLQEVLRNAEKSIGFGSEVLRAMRQGNAAENIWRAVGRCIGFPEATLLLAFLCESSRELGRFFNSEAERSAQAQERSMRTVREQPPQASCSPQGWEFPEQCANELGNALSKLSQESTCFRETIDLLMDYTGMPLANRPPARVGRLRGYGNAIVPQVAAEIIRTVMG